MIKIKNITTVGDEMAIAWSDGEESYISFERLRKSCPCADCQGEPDALGRVVKPNVRYNENSMRLLGYEVMGGYALNLRWADGHKTGLYSFDYIRAL